MEYECLHELTYVLINFAKGDASRLFTKNTDDTDLVRGKFIDNTEIAKLIPEVINK